MLLNEFAYTECVKLNMFTACLVLYTDCLLVTGNALRINIFYTAKGDGASGLGWRWRVLHEDSRGPHRQGWRHHFVGVLWRVPSSSVSGMCNVPSPAGWCSHVYINNLYVLVLFVCHRIVGNVRHAVSWLLHISFCFWVVSHSIQFTHYCMSELNV